MRSTLHYKTLILLCLGGVLGMLPDNMMAQSRTPAKNCRVMQPRETRKMLRDTSFAAFNIRYRIWRAYTCNDRKGPFHILLTESSDSITPLGDTLNSRIRALCIRDSGNRSVLAWELNDHTIPAVTGMELNICFWTRFCRFEDQDGDGLCDPIVVYGTDGPMYSCDRRVKIIVYHKGMKIALRHQDSDMDFGRYLQVDSAFHLMPLPLKEKVVQLMKEMESRAVANFPNDWETALKRGELHIRE